MLAHINSQIDALAMLRALRAELEMKQMIAMGRIDAWKSPTTKKVSN